MVFRYNLNLSRIIKVGSTKPYLQEITIQIYDLCIQFNIKIVLSWIPRELNGIADYMSIYNDTDSWGIDFETFKFIQNKYDNFTVDRFTDNTNRKIKNFNSKFHCPDSMGVNPFAFIWSGHFNWLCLPISLIGEIIIHMKLCKARGVLCIPKWEAL